jgi:uncharacterized membrane protein
MVGPAFLLRRSWYAPCEISIQKLFSISDPKVGKLAWNHMILNLIAVAIFALSFYLRLGNTAGAILPILLSVAGVLFVAASGWLGGEMVYVYGMGVEQPPGSPASQRRKAKDDLRRVG